MARTIDLEERKQFRVLLNPVRQDIIHLLRRAGRPMTANTVAEKMLLSPSAAQSLSLIHISAEVLIVLVRRADGTTVVPKGGTVLQQGDMLVVNEWEET